MKASKEAIQAFFQQHPRRVFAPAELQRTLADNAKEWRLGLNDPPSRRVAKLARAAGLKRAQLTSDVVPDVTRFVKDTASELDIALSLGKAAYLSHATALELHGLIGQQPTIFVNHEQAPKPAPDSVLVQQRIDAAFQRKQRMTNKIYTYEKRRIVVLNGKASGRFGVVPVILRGVSVDVTGVERALIDATVRPAYVGGASQVLIAYKSARRRVSISTLESTLAHLDFTYPYHQLVGFYLTKAGFRPEDTAVFRSREISFNFYAEHQMQDPAFDVEWRVFFPKDLDC